MSAPTAPPLTLEGITQMFMELDRTIARHHGDVSEALAGCHLGLGVRMLVELGYEPEVIADMARGVADSAAADLVVPSGQN